MINNKGVNEAGVVRAYTRGKPDPLFSVLDSRYCRVSVSNCYYRSLNDCLQRSQALENITQCSILIPASVRARPKPPASSCCIVTHRKFGMIVD